jgi:hypothetical protein
MIALQVFGSSVFKNVIPFFELAYLIMGLIVIIPCMHTLVLEQVNPLHFIPMPPSLLSPLSNSIWWVSLSFYICSVLRSSPLSVSSFLPACPITIIFVIIILCLSATNEWNMQYWPFFWAWLIELNIRISSSLFYLVSVNHFSSGIVLYPKAIEVTLTSFSLLKSLKVQCSERNFFS